ncbi:MAG TPA: cadherin domain-containing protein, partial [Polymorphobacter sp.]|nr:cadherin domain-containing protein [Polymorphobacter sp.]
QAAAVAADGTTTFAWTLGGTDAARFNIDASTGAVSFKTPPNFEAPADAGANNVYDITVTAADDTLTGSRTVAITVTGVNEAPVITSNGGGASAAVTIAENTTAITTVTAADPDAGAALTYSISGGADAAKFSINAATGALVLIAAPDFDAPADNGADNVYDVIVRASDGALSATQALAVSVTNVNETPSITGGPNTAISIAENTSVVATIAANDPDASTALTYSINGGADAAKFSIDAATGALAFVTAPDFETPTDSGANNIYDVTVRASDGTLFADQAVAVTVTDVAENVAPVITSDGASLRAWIARDSSVADQFSMTSSWCKCSVGRTEKCRGRHQPRHKGQ